MQQINTTLFSLQATPMEPGHTRVSGGQDPQDTKPGELVQQSEGYQPPVVLALLANVIGGTLLLFAMILLPHFIAGLLN